MHPSRYGAEPSERHEPYDLDRDATTLKLIPLAIEMGVPLFAICRGFQELNVALGGTLITEAQERPGSLDHRAPIDLPQRRALQARARREFRGGQPPREAPRRALHQGEFRAPPGDRPARPRLVVEARAPDGTIEAVRVADAHAFAFGVQWHPEYWAATDPASGALFRAFAAAARERAGTRLPLAAE